MISLDEKFLLEYHIIGQTYTTKVIYSFVGCFHLGLITGFILFNYEGSKKRINKLIYENYLNYFSERESIKCSDKALLEDDESSSISSNSNNNNDNEIKNRIEVQYDSNYDCWHIQTRPVKKYTFGGSLHALIRAYGDILAVWIDV